MILAKPPRLFSGHLQLSNQKSYLFYKALAFGVSHNWILQLNLIASVHFFLQAAKKNSLAVELDLVKFA